MAVIVNQVSLDNGIIVNDAYVRIDTISGTKNNLVISLNYYVDRNASMSGVAMFKQELQEFQPSIEESSPNFFKQGYECIKMLPHFVGAVDVIEG